MTLPTYLFLLCTVMNPSKVMEARHCFVTTLQCFQGNQPNSAKVPNLNEPQVIGKLVECIH